MVNNNIDNFMLLAIEQAQIASNIGEVPVGAVVVYDNQIIGVGHNRRMVDADATAHAEIMAIRQAGQTLQRWNLSDCDLWVTLEPCPMCAGAIVNARIRTVYFGATDSKFGAMGSQYKIGIDGLLNHTTKVINGVLQDQCSQLLSNFFAQLRKDKPKK